MSKQLVLVGGGHAHMVTLANLSAFIEKGYHVLGSVRDLEKGKNMEMELGDQFTPLLFDIRNTDQLKAAKAKVEEHLKGQTLTAIINNAGTAEIGPLLHVDPANFLEQLNILVVGQLNVIQHFYNFLIPKDSNEPVGKIYNISSVSGKGSNYLFGCYAAGKHALEGMSKTLRKELRIYGIDVVVVAPGNIATAIWYKQTDQHIDQYKDTIYYQPLKQTLNNIQTLTVANAMCTDSFSEAFFHIFKIKRPKRRYTIVKSKRRFNPFSQYRARVFEW